MRKLSSRITEAAKAKLQCSLKEILLMGATAILPQTNLWVKIFLERNYCLTVNWKHSNRCRLTLNNKSQLEVCQEFRQIIFYGIKAASVLIQRFHETKGMGNLARLIVRSINWSETASRVKDRSRVMLKSCKQIWRTNKSTKTSSMKYPRTWRTSAMLHCTRWQLLLLIKWTSI